MDTGVQRVRAKVVSRFERALGDPRLARHLEICLWNWTIRTSVRDGIPRFWANSRFRYRYTTRALSLAFNASHPRNPGVGQRLRSGELSVKTFASMTHLEMFPELYEPIFERLASRELRKMAVSHEDAPDGVYTCRACKSKKTQYTCLQTRSADEPMSIYVSCLHCGKRWKD